MKAKVLKANIVYLLKTILEQRTAYLVVYYNNNMDIIASFVPYGCPIYIYIGKYN